MVVSHAPDQFVRELVSNILVDGDSFSMGSCNFILAYINSI